MRMKRTNCLVYSRHAEGSCLNRMLHSHETTEDAIMMVSHAPYKMCSLRIKEARIKSVFYREDYGDLSLLSICRSLRWKCKRFNNCS